MLNLLSNAFKFTLNGKVTVRVRPASDGEWVEMQVHDTGLLHLWLPRAGDPALA